MSLEGQVFDRWYRIQRSYKTGGMSHIYLAKALQIVFPPLQSLHAAFKRKYRNFLPNLILKGQHLIPDISDLIQNIPLIYL